VNIPKSIKKLAKGKNKADKVSLGDTFTAVSKDRSGKVKQHVTTDTLELELNDQRGSKVEVTVSSTESDDDKLLHLLFSGVRKKK